MKKPPLQPARATFDAVSAEASPANAEGSGGGTGIVSEAPGAGGDGGALVGWEAPGAGGVAASTDDGSGGLAGAG